MKRRLEKVKKILKKKLEELFTVRNYFIDFENVQSAGLKGIEKLKKNDRVYFMYSKNASTMHMDAVRKMHECVAEIEFIDIKHLGKNALDFQLCALMGEKIGKFRGKNLELYIVSNDTGYDSVKHGTYEMFKETFKKKGKTLSIRRICNFTETIDAEDKKKNAEEKARSIVEEKREKLKAIVDVALKGSNYTNKATTIVDLLMKKTSPIDFHNKCCQTFGSEDGRNIYLLLKPSL